MQEFSVALQRSGLVLRNTTVCRRGARPGSERMNASLAVASGLADQAAAPPPASGLVQAKLLAALSLAPLVAVAWAEGGVDDREKSLVLSWAKDAGLREGDHAYGLVEQWLAAPPSPELLALWKAHYAARLSLVLTADAKRELKLHLLDRARALIEATGAFSGIGQSPSHAEQSVIDEITAALS